MPTYTHKYTPRRIVALGAAVIMVVLLSVTHPFSARAEMASLKQATGEMSIGRADAPITLDEYASLTCGHCARFHKDTLPEIKKKYVDTGKVRIVFHDFPLDGLAVGAVMIARCSGPDRFADFTDMLFQTQANWRDSKNPLNALIALARFYGLGGQDVNACLKNKDLLNFVQRNRDNASSAHAITSTPTFIVDGKKIEGAQPFDVFKTALDAALAAHGAT
ncbi:MAG: DsbA family protein [Magnetovibrio sp.]|nr:DsbA family protein [Magnetovibrio sp.]